MSDNGSFVVDFNQQKKSCLFFFSFSIAETTSSSNDQIEKEPKSDISISSFK